MRIYVDGSFREKIGWAFIAVDDKGFELCRQFGTLVDPELCTMRQIAGECEAVINGLTWAISKNIKEVEVAYDYTGVEKWVTGEWAAKKPYTKSYTNKVQNLMKSIEVKFMHVRAHTGEVINERVDKLAKLGN